MLIHLGHICKVSKPLGFLVILLVCSVPSSVCHFHELTLFNTLGVHLLQQRAKISLLREIQ